MSRILIVDDEPQILRVLRASLTAGGYQVVSAANGLEALDVFQKVKPDLIITDMSMPSMDGYALTEEVRQISNVPIIVLSVRASEPVKVSALDAGADDYITKPFNMPELLARVRAQLRRDVSKGAPSAEIKIGDFQVTQATRETLVRGSRVHLSPKEYDLLLVFLQQPDRVLTHRALGSAVWGHSTDGQTEKLRVLVAQLRKKIEEDGIHYVHSEPWVGYRFTPTPLGSL